MAPRSVTVTSGSLPVAQGGLFDHLVTAGAADAPGEVWTLLDPLRQALASGGRHLRVTSDRAARLTPGERQSTGSGREQASEGIERPIFDVLALDVAIAYPQDLSTSKLLGRQACWCLAPNAASPSDNWYYRALTNYFAQGGSLLAHPERHLNADRWWLLTPGEMNIATPGSGQLSHAVEWTGTFDPGEDRAGGSSLDTRFRQFGLEVFDALAPHVSSATLQSAALVWVYVAPPSQEWAEGRQHFVNRWDASLFAVIRPSDVDPDPEWPGRAGRSREALLYGVQDAYFTLALGARSQLERHSAYSQLQFSAVQAVSHHYKNEMQDIATLGGFLTDEMAHLRKTLPPGAPGAALIDRMADNVDRLSALSRLTSAVALATFRLANPGALGGIVFEETPRAAVVASLVAKWLLWAYASLRTQWKVDLPEGNALLSELQNVFDAPDQFVLFERLDVALLVFVLSEPIRNVRRIDATVEGSHVHVQVEVRADAVVVMQRTLESSPVLEGSSIHSTSVDRVNALLSQLQATHSVPFATLAPARVITCTPTKRDRYRVVRETVIRIHRLPRLVA